MQLACVRNRKFVFESKMSVVRHRLKIFEQDTNSDNMASNKPVTPLKPPNFSQNMSPALKNFMNKQNEVLSGKTGQGSVSEVEGSLTKSPVVSTKNGLNTGIKTEQDENLTPVSASKIIAAKPTIGAAKSADSRRSSQVNVPSIFQQDSVNPVTNLESRRSSQVHVPEVFKQDSNNATHSEVNSSQESRKPKPFVKPGSVNPRPSPGPKPQLATTSDAPLPGKTISASILLATAPSILPATNKPNDVKLNNTSFVLKDSKFKLPAMEQIPLKNVNSSGTSLTLPSTSSSATSQPQSPPSDGKVIDFRSMLRSTKTPPTNQPAGKIKPTTIKPMIPPTVSSTSKVTDADVNLPIGHDTSSSNGSADTNLSNNSQKQPDVPVTHTQSAGSKWKPAQELKRPNDSSVLERKSDAKKFKNVNLGVGSPVSAPPEKPTLPGNIDLTLVKNQYHKTIQIFNQGSGTNNINVDENDGEVYDDGLSLSDVVTRQSNIKKQQVERESIIPEMSAEEEGMYDDGCTQVYPKPISPRLPPVLSSSASVSDGDGMYVDAETERKGQQEEELDQVYEDEETFALNTEKLEEERKRRQKEEAEAKKKEEKERREREKEEEKKRKKEEKERLKKEKEELQLRKKFSLTGTETNVGEGIIKQDVKGGVLGGLSLKKGQTITIVRVDNNPPNKWLIKSDTGMGYIDSSNIEIDPNIIRQAMLNKIKDNESKECEDQPVYDDVPHDGQPNDLIDDGEIYEECP